MKRFAIAACLLTVACVPEGETSRPLVSDYNGHTVKVQWHQYALGADFQKSPAYMVAAETCGGPASYQGIRQVGSFAGEHVFICQR